MAKGKIKITPQEQLSLRNRARDTLMKLDQTLADEETMRLVNSFINKFYACEITYKVILEDHQYRKTGVHANRLQIDMRQAPHALAYAGYDFDKDLLARIFGSENKPGRRSAKKIRDAISHAMEEKAIEELKNRQTALFADMDAFLDKIRAFDLAAV